jgi:hypothetical protein
MREPTLGGCHQRLLTAEIETSPCCMRMGELHSDVWIAGRRGLREIDDNE